LLGLRVPPLLRETLRSRNGLDVLSKLGLPFSPYRQRPDITLHGPGASRTAIPLQDSGRIWVRTS